MKRYELELFPGHSITLLLFKNVTNGAEIKNAVLQDTLPGAGVDARLVPLPRLCGLLSMPACRRGQRFSWES